MPSPYLTSVPLPQFDLWQRLETKRALLAFELELTARCNNRCRHCYINLPANDFKSKGREMSPAFIDDIARQAVEMGALWCLLTGGEPLLRIDFPEIYLRLKKRGLLVSLFTNAILVNDEHIKLFKRYPPRDIEVTVYGVTRRTYERVSCVPGSFSAFLRGVDRLLDAGLKVRFKAMALRSNLHEMQAIAEFCRQRTKDYFRFDPVLHLRYDRNPERNRDIVAERLSPAEIVALEQADPQRQTELQKSCAKWIQSTERPATGHLFYCGAGNSGFTVGWNGSLRLCASLCREETVYDLSRGTLMEFWQEHIPTVRRLRSQRPEFLTRCHRCALVNLCAWCPAHADLETGHLDDPVECFCAIAHSRKELIKPLGA